MSRSSGRRQHSKLFQWHNTCSNVLYENSMKFANNIVHTKKETYFEVLAKHEFEISFIKHFISNSIFISATRGSNTYRWHLCTHDRTQRAFNHNYS